MLTKKQKKQLRENTRRWRVKNPDRNREKARNWYRENREQSLERQRKHRARPEYKRYELERHLWALYRLPIKDYDRMLLEQGGKCYVSGEHDPMGLCVDHDHKTGRVRRLLSRRCNIILGLADDDPILLEKLAAYIRQFNV